jgi:hypothetical protein
MGTRVRAAQRSVYSGDHLGSKTNRSSSRRESGLWEYPSCSGGCSQRFAMVLPHIHPRRMASTKQSCASTNAPMVRMGQLHF